MVYFEDTGKRGENPYWVHLNGYRIIDLFKTQLGKKIHREIVEQIPFYQKDYTIFVQYLHNLETDYNEIKEEIMRDEWNNKQGYILNFETWFMQNYDEVEGYDDLESIMCECS